MNQMLQRWPGNQYFKHNQESSQVGLIHISDNNTPLLSYCPDSVKTNSFNGENEHNSLG